MTATKSDNQDDDLYAYYGVDAERVRSYGITSLDDLEYTIASDGSHASVSGYNGESPVVVIPPFIDGKPVTNVGKYAFRHDPPVEEVYLPDTVTFAPYECFTGMSSLRALNLGSYTADYLERNFWDLLIGCTSLERLTMSDSANFPIGLMGQYGKDLDIMEAAVVNHLKYIYLGSSMSEVVPNLFYGDSLEWVDVGEGNPLYSSHNGVVYSPDGTELLVMGSEYTGEYVVSDSCTTIGSIGFEQCNKVTRIYIPSSITSMSLSAFSSCSATVVTPQGSYAAEFCAKNGIPVVLLQGEGPDSPPLVDVANATVAPIGDQTFTNSAITPRPEVTADGEALVEGTDYTLEYANNTNAGTASIIITGMGICTGTRTVEFTIVPRDLSGAEVSPIPTQAYTGREVTPKPDVTIGGTRLAEGTDYILSYTDNVDKGDATLTITGCGNYAGSRSVAFAIDTGEFVADITLSAVTFTYNGLEQRPTVTSVSVAGTVLDPSTYTVAMPTGCVDAGTYTVEVTLKDGGDFTGTGSANFTIRPADVSGATASSIPRMEYTGVEIRPDVTLTVADRTLVAETDYTPTYRNNVNVGTATVTLTGRGNYTGQKVISFVINPADISKATVVGDTSKGYDAWIDSYFITVRFGGVVLTENVDYRIAMSGGTSWAYTNSWVEAEVAIEGMGNFRGEKKASFHVAKDGCSFFEDAWLGDTTNHGDEVDWMGRSGISEGWVTTWGREFRGLQDVKRCDFAAFLYRFADLSDDGERNDSNALSAAEVASTLAGVSDCTAKTDHAAEVAWMIASGISKGWVNDDGTIAFRPRANVARQDMAAFLYRYADLTDDGAQNGSLAAGTETVAFSDVRHGDTRNHAEEVEWLASVGVTKGWKVGSRYQFRGTNNVARQDMAAFMYRLNEYLN